MHIFLRTKFNDFLMWQVAAKVAAEPLCVQVRSHATIFHLIFPCDRLLAKIYDVNTKVKSKNHFKIGWHSISIDSLMRIVS